MKGSEKEKFPQITDGAKPLPTQFGTLLIELHRNLIDTSTGRRPLAKLTHLDHPDSVTLMVRMCLHSGKVPSLSDGGQKCKTLAIVPECHDQ
jgi:hypothetical protein